MGERKGQNKYYPPDFDYKKHKSLAGYHGQHPLRERARKLDQGILIIRFEMPYNIWCDGCKSHVAMGVRYNAEKSKIGMYYTTPIYKFRMKCHLCDNHYEIKTDPAKHDYVIISGARRKEQRWDPHENEQIVPEDRVTQKKLALDSMYKLEHGVGDQQRSKMAAPTIADIVEHQEAHKDDFALNQLARKQFRDVKKANKAAVSRDDEIKQKFSLDVDLVAESKDDVRLAELLQYSSVESYDDRQKAKRKSIESRPLFSVDEETPSTSSSSSSSRGSIDRRKMATLSHIRQLSDLTVARRRVAAFDSNQPPKKRSKIVTNKLLTGLKIKCATKTSKHKAHASTRGLKRLKVENINSADRLDVAVARPECDVPSVDGGHLVKPVTVNNSESLDNQTAQTAINRNLDSRSRTDALSSLISAYDSSSVPNETAVDTNANFPSRNNALSSLVGNYDSSSHSSNSDD